MNCEFARIPPNVSVTDFKSHYDSAKNKVPVSLYLLSERINWILTNRTVRKCFCNEAANEIKKNNGRWKRRNRKKNLSIFNEIECHSQIITDWNGNFVELLAVISESPKLVDFMYRNFCQIFVLRFIKYIHFTTFWQSLSPHLLGLNNKRKKTSVNCTHTVHEIFPIYTQN